MDEEQEEKAPIEERRGGTEISVASGLVDDVEERVELPDELPVLPLKNTVLFPYLLSPLLVNTPALAAADRRGARAARIGCWSARRSSATSRARPASTTSTRVGTVLRVVKMLKFPDDSYRLLVQGVARVRLERVHGRRIPILRATIRRIEDVGQGPSRSR